MYPKPFKRRWEREGGEPSLHNKGPVSRQLRAIADAVLLQAQENICVLCGLELDYPHVARDHSNPFSLSRDDSLWNTRLAHPECDRLRRREPLTPKQKARFNASAAQIESLLALLVRPRTLAALVPSTVPPVLGSAQDD